MSNPFVKITLPIGYAYKKIFPTPGENEREYKQRLEEMARFLEAQVSIEKPSEKSAPENSMREHVNCAAILQEKHKATGDLNVLESDQGGNALGDMPGEECSAYAVSESGDLSVPDKNARKQVYEDSMKELESLVGLDVLKKEVQLFLANIEIMKRKEKAGYKQEFSTMHMIFQGPPGTGKTTVARLLSRILYGQGYLDKAEVIETDRTGLIAGHVGQTALKTKDVMEKAKGGVLFIDEAYAINPGSNPDQGFEQECVDTIVKYMEDWRKEIILIFAGYDDRMNDFLDSNPGLESRIPYRFHFEAYDVDELVSIAKTILAKKQYTLGAAAQKRLDSVIQRLYPVSGDENGRMVRNLVERMEIEQNYRLYQKKNEMVSDKELMKILPSDLENAFAFVFNKKTED